MCTSFSQYIYNTEDTLVNIWGGGGGMLAVI
jgi:hypothetical protein